jgi:probable phosphoglycerate mutase
MSKRNRNVFKCARTKSDYNIGAGFRKQPYSIISDMKLILARHGETIANSKQILQGKEGGKLTKKGIEQAKHLGKHLKEHHKIDMVFCSPLDRCVETLEHVLSEYPIEGEILMSKLIEERDFGEYTGVETFMIDWNEMNKESKINREMGLESIAEMEKRVHLFLEDLKLENEDATVLVLSHSGTIRTMINKITGQEIEKIEIENATAIEFDYRAEN